MSPCLMVATLLLGGAVGCGDEHQSLIDSVDQVDMGRLNPDDPESQRPSDMGADWRGDAADAAEPPPWRPGDIDEGAELVEDAALPDAVLPDAAPIDAEPVDYGPDYALPEDPLRDRDLGLGGDGEADDALGPPEQGEIDPTAIEVPRCGTFGPAEQLAAGPGAVMTFLHAGPGVLFDEPALAGCQPGRLRNEDAERLWQEMFFDYRWQRVLGWLWQIDTLDGLGYRLTGRAVYGGDGRVIWASHACVGAAEPELYSFFYRDDQLLEVRLQRPANCLPMAAGLNQSVRYRYGDHPRWPEARVVESDDGELNEVQLEYDLDRNVRVRRVAGIREYGPLQDLQLERRFSYDADGRVTEEIRTPSGGGRVERIRYAYDGEGRLVERSSSTEHLEIGYDAAGDIEYVRATNPAFVVRELRFPERCLLEPAPMDAEPVPTDDGWR